MVHTSNMEHKSFYKLILWRAVRQNGMLWSCFVCATVYQIVQLWHEKPYSNLMCLIFIGTSIYNVHRICIYFWFQDTLSDERESHEVDSNAYTLSNEEGFMSDKSGDDPDSSSDDDDGENVSVCNSYVRVIIQYSNTVVI